MNPKQEYFVKKKRKHVAIPSEEGLQLQPSPILKKNRFNKKSKGISTTSAVEAVVLEEDNKKIRSQNEVNFGSNPHLENQVLPSNGVENGFYLISDINDSTINWRIIAKITHLWNAEDPISHEFKSLDMILQGHNGDKIHAKVGLYNVLRFKKNLHEGGIYDISNFRVYSVKGKFRPVQHKFLIYFKKETNLIPIEEPSYNFPQEKFEFVDFVDIPYRKDNIYLTDVIGILKIWRPAHVINERGTFRREIDLINGSGSTLRVVLWESLATKIADESITTRISNKVVMVVTGASVKDFNGLHLSSTPATIIFLDLDIPNSTYLKNSLSSPKVQILQNVLPAQAITLDPTTGRKLSLSDIDHLVKDDSVEKFSCEATISNILLDYGWFYIACKRCQTKVMKKENEGYDCKKCGTTKQTMKMYHLRFEICDETEKLNVSAFDKEAESIIDKPISDLINLQNSDFDTLLTLFDNLVGYRGSFDIKINQYNREHKDAYFNVSKVTPLKEIDDQKIDSKVPCSLKFDEVPDSDVEHSSEGQEVSDCDEEKDINMKRQEKVPCSLKFDEVPDSDVEHSSEGQEVSYCDEEKDINMKMQEKVPTSFPTSNGFEEAPACFGNSLVEATGIQKTSSKKGKNKKKLMNASSSKKKDKNKKKVMVPISLPSLTEVEKASDCDEVSLNEKEKEKSKSQSNKKCKRSSSKDISSNSSSTKTHDTQECDGAFSVKGQSTTKTKRMRKPNPKFLQ